jgi:hypothetical protein
MSQGIHRVTANSKRGRQMISPGKFWEAANQDKIIAEWSAKVEAKKQEKQQRKQWLTGGIRKTK